MKTLVRLTAIAALMMLGPMAHAGLVSITYASDNDCSGAYSSDDVCSIFELVPMYRDDRLTGWEPTGEAVSDIIGKTEGSSQSVYNDFDFDWNDVTFKNGSGVVVNIPDGLNSGMWEFDGTNEESLIRFWVNKAGSGFTLHFYSDNFDGANNAACSAGNPTGNTYACLMSAITTNSGTWDNSSNSLSHLSFYNGTGTTTVPEPGTLALLGLGLLGMGAARRRKVA